MKKYIYIDTKIKGAVLQLISYFKNNVFDKDFIVIFKLYKENKDFLKLMKKNNIKYIVFSFYRQFPNIKNSIVFYLFNAQSNCRVVAYREAKHVFVTHGESNKLSSVKPILRIYDYIIIAGDAGIERLLNYKIFNQYDLQSNKLLRMGNTFIGNLNFNFNKNSNSLLYAPTWEGGLKEENYSSITKDIESFRFIANYATKNNINNIFIQIHPNIGHRNKKYIIYIYRGIKYLIQNNFKVKINNINNTFLKFVFFKYKDIIVDFNEILDVRMAFCDISAIESQLLDRNIPYFIFFNNSKKIIPINKLLEQYYTNIAIKNFDDSKNIFFDIKLQNLVKNYYISYESKDLYNKSYKRKIEWLIRKIV